MLQVWECRSRIARTLIANKCLTAFRVGLLQYLSLLWLCLLAFLGLNLGAKAAMVRSVPCCGMSSVHQRPDITLLCWSCVNQCMFLLNIQQQLVCTTVTS